MAESQKQSTRPNRFYQKDTGQAKKQLKSSKYNAKLIKYSHKAPKFPFWGAHLVVKGLYLISLVCIYVFWVVFWYGQGFFDQVPIWSL